MRAARERQGVEPVQFRRIQRPIRGRDDGAAPSRRLDGVGAGFVDLTPQRDGARHELPGIGDDGFVRRQLDDLRAGGQLGSSRLQPGRAGQAAQRAAEGSGLGTARRSRIKPAGEGQDGALGHAVNEQVGLAVDQDRRPHGVRPEIVVRDAPQGGLDAAQHHGQTGECVPQQVGVDDAGPVRAGPRRPPGV